MQQRFPKKTYQAALGLLALQLLSGCDALKDPSRRGETAVNPGEQWDPNCSPWYCPKIEPSSPVEALVLPDTTSSTDIVGLLDIALTNHPVTRSAWAQARAQAFQVGIVDSAFYPIVTGSESIVIVENTVGGGVGSTGATGIAIPVGSGGAAAAAQGFASGNVNAFSSSGTSKYLNSNLNVSYLVLDFGGRYASSEAARQALYALNWTQNRTIQEVIFNVMQGYYNYVNAKETLVARKSDLENAEMTLKNAEAQHAAGLAPILDVLQAKSNDEGAKLAVVSAESQLKIALGALANALGIPPSMEFEAKDFPEIFPVDDIAEGVEGLMNLARDNRPDLAAAQATILANQMNVKAAVSAAMPTLTANVNVQQLSFFHNASLDGHIYTGVLTLNVPLFNGFFNVNQIRQAKENVRVAKANYETLEHQALLDVLAAYYNFVSAKESLKFAEDYLKYAQESYNAALDTYRVGTGTILNVLTTQATLSDAKSQRIASRTQWATSIFNIAFATGTLTPSFVRREMDESQNGDCE